LTWINNPGVTVSQVGNCWPRLSTNAKLSIRGNRSAGVVAIYPIESEQMNLIATKPLDVVLLDLWFFTYLIPARRCIARKLPTNVPDFYNSSPIFPVV